MRCARRTNGPNSIRAAVLRGCGRDAAVQASAFVARTGGDEQCIDELLRRIDCYAFVDAEDEMLR